VLFYYLCTKGEVLHRQAYPQGAQSKDADVYKWVTLFSASPAVCQRQHDGAHAWRPDEGGDEERLRQMNEERMSSGEMNPPEGLKKVLLLGNNEAGKRLFITFFDDREAVAAAEQRFEQMGDEISEEIRGRRTSVDVYEVVFDEAT
jgi:hypothetical protein